jgi:hypothetical protein
MELMDQVKYSNHVKPVEAIRSAELLNLRPQPLASFSHGTIRLMAIITFSKQYT